MNKLATWLNSLSEGHRPSFAECTSYLSAYFPLLLEFERTPQDNQWHAEGNVEIHTDMVLQQTYRLFDNEAHHLTGCQQRILILSALLHDIAKPLTTREKEINGEWRIVAPKHEEVGAAYLATRLIQLPLNHSDILTVTGLVGWHQQPKLLVVRDKDYADYFALSRNADLELLYWLELADMRGRTCADLAQQIDLLEQYKLFAQDFGLWSQTMNCQRHLVELQVKNDKSQQCYLDNVATYQLVHDEIKTAPQAIAKNYSAGKNYSHLYVTCGVSGSGKSSWIAANLPDFEVISLDDIRGEISGKSDCQKHRGQVLQLAKQRLKFALANKINVVWDATNIRYDFRKIICDLGINYGALVTMVIFQVEEKTLRRNNANRQRNVDDQVIDSQLDKLQWPWPTEAHRTLYIGEKGVKLNHFGKF